VVSLRLKHLRSSLFAIILLSIFAGIPVFAGGQGSIRIEPHAFDPPDPVTLSSPASFNVTVNKNKIAYNPQLLLVTSYKCLEDLSGPITVSWDWIGPYYTSIGLDKSSFIEVDPKSNSPQNKWIPPEINIFGKIYEASSLASHLDSGENTIWYCYLDMPVNDDKIIDTDEYVKLTVTVPSNSPRLLVYVFGDKSKVPNSRPGFVIPEVALGTIMAVASMMAALSLRKKMSLK
jgi:hypothetical protein